MKIPADVFYRMKCLHCLVLLSGYRQSKAVDDNVPPGNAVFIRHLQDRLRVLDTLLCVPGHTGFLQGKPDHTGTVFFDDRKDLSAFLLIRADGIDDGSAVCRPEPCFDGGRGGRVDLKGQVGHALNRPDDFGHQRGFIRSRKSHIDIEYVRTGLSLFDGTFHDVVHVMFPKRLLEPLLAGRIDPLADHAHRAVKICHPSGRADSVSDPPSGRGLGKRIARGILNRFRCSSRIVNRWVHASRHSLTKSLDEGGLCAAASAHDTNAHGRIYCHLPGKALRCHRVGSGPWIRQAGIGFDDHGKIRSLTDQAYHRNQLFRAEGTVDTHSVNSEGIQCQCHGSRISSCKCAPVFFKGHGHPYGKRGVLFGGKDSGSDFCKIGHCLEYDKICPRIFAGDDDLLKAFIGIFKGECAEGFHQFSDGTDIESNANLPYL